jgi:hypothetical protein
MAISTRNQKAIATSSHNQRSPLNQKPAIATSIPQTNDRPPTSQTNDRHINPTNQRSPSQPGKTTIALHLTNQRSPPHSQNQRSPLTSSNQRSQTLPKTSDRPLTPINQ